MTSAVSPAARRSDASAQRGQNNFLRRLLGHPGIFDQGRRLLAPHPMLHCHLLELNLEAERFQFGGHIFDRLLRLIAEPVRRGPILFERCATCR